MHHSQTKQIRMLTEGAAMIALATVLSFLKVYEAPWGGAITVLSMLPIAAYSLKYGVLPGLLVGFLHSLIQLFISLGQILGWGLSPTILVLCIVFDYLVPFTLLGTAGLFRKRGLVGEVGGVAFALSLRFLSHFGSGVWIWESVGEVLGFTINNTYLYSLVYNGFYMLPETVFTCLGAYFLLRVKSVRRVLFED